MPSDKGDVHLPTVLFLCIHNAGRSQMALGFFTELAQGRAVGYSGGSEPANQINAAAIAAMNEADIDIARQVPRRWSESDLEEADVVVTMGCGDTCPYFPGTRYEDWPIDDPAGLPLDDVRPIRDEIRARVERLLGQLGVSTAA
jgi:protein-tyrosine-phosphatase